MAVVVCWGREGLDKAATVWYIRVDAIRRIGVLAYKSVRLYWSQDVQSREYESPVLVSPTIDGEYNCHICGATYSPLVYAPGKNVVAHHFHVEDDDVIGGIYHYHSRTLGEIQRNAERYCLGFHIYGETRCEKLTHDKTDYAPFYDCNATPDFAVMGVIAYCTLCGVWLDNGFLYRSTFPLYENFLYPLCTGCMVERRSRLEFAFSIVDGELLISLMEPIEDGRC